ncbi:MAG: DUF2513 domain-containing protein [Phycisphaerales bacterium]|nr:MAG: DUF2513 domain-containing protein [Phycisphaerales bacterium]
MDLVRLILFKLEEHEHGLAPRPLGIDGYTEEQIGYHVHLMGQAGLLKVADTTVLRSKSPRAMPLHMLWAGHDFLDAAREPTRWTRAVERVKKAGGPMTLEILKEVLIAIAREGLGLR